MAGGQLPAGSWRPLDQPKKNKKTTAGYISSVNRDNQAGTTGGGLTQKQINQLLQLIFLIDCHLPPAQPQQSNKKKDQYLWPYVSKKSTFCKSLDLTC